MRVPSAIKRFVDVFSSMPGIGPRQAIRLAFYVIGRGVAFEEDIKNAIEDLKRIQPCKNCFYIHENKNGLCDICSDPTRDISKIAIVEKETDLMSMENTGKFRGRYFIIGDFTRSGILETDQKLKLKSLKALIERESGGKAGEIIIATNPTPHGDVIASLIAGELNGFADKITRLGRGIPMGGEIEFADEDTLGSAIEKRG